MKFIWLLRKICLFLPSKWLETLALREQPHPLALRETGIRIVSFSFETNQEFQFQQDEIWEALKLLQKYAPLQMKRITEHISIICIRTTGGYRGSYLKTGKFCALNLSSFSKGTAKTRQITIAGILVHEATHGKIEEMKIPYCGSTVNRIEKICIKEQSKTTEKLANLI
jgi:hypothetical protein